MNRIVLTLFLIFLRINLQASLIFTQANEAYHNKDFNEAIKLYKESLNNEQSLEQHFNLGNAYYETNDYGNAILHYKKALTFNFHNPDILKNIDLVNNNLKIDTPKISLQQHLAHLFTGDQWSIFFISSLALILIILILILFLNANNLFIKLILFASIASTVASIFSYFYYSQELDTGIILVNDSSLLVSPTSTSPVIASLALGSEVYLHKAKQAATDWPFVKTLNNQEGWINPKDLGLIWK